MDSVTKVIHKHASGYSGGRIAGIFAAICALVGIGVAMVTLTSSTSAFAQVAGFLVGGFLVTWIARSRLEKSAEIIPTINTDTSQTARILYLRSFRQDRTKLVTVPGRMLWVPDLIDFEMLVAIIARPYGVPTAVLNRQPSKVLYGFAQAGIADDRWRDEVVYALGASAAIVWHAGETTELMWELDAVLERDMLHKLIVLVAEGDPIVRRRILNSTLGRLGGAAWFDDAIVHADAPAMCIYIDRERRARVSMLRTSSSTANALEWREVLDSALACVVRGHVTSLPGVEALESA